MSRHPVDPGVFMAEPLQCIRAGVSCIYWHDGIVL